MSALTKSVARILRAVSSVWSEFRLLFPVVQLLSPPGCPSQHPSSSICCALCPHPVIPSVPAFPPESENAAGELGSGEPGKKNISYHKLKLLVQENVARDWTGFDQGPGGVWVVKTRLLLRQSEWRIFDCLTVTTGAAHALKPAWDPPGVGGRVSGTADLQEEKQPVLVCSQPVTPTGSVKWMQYKHTIL